MSDSENTTQPLLSPPRQTVINVGEQGVRSSRAYKVTAITVFACVLIAGQVMIAYFLLNQRTDIKALEEQNNNLKAEMKNGRSVDVPMRMHIPMNTLPKLMTDSVDEEASSDAPEKMVPLQRTNCQMEAAGLKAVQVPGFRPQCDAHGLYQAQQCFLGNCWCVDRVSGKEIPCRGAVFTGGLSNMLTMSDADV